jgi:hypothetical protein
MGYAPGHSEMYWILVFCIIWLSLTMLPQFPPLLGDCGSYSGSLQSAAAISLKSGRLHVRADLEFF